MLHCYHIETDQRHRTGRPQLAAPGPVPAVSTAERAGNPLLAKMYKRLSKEAGTWRRWSTNPLEQVKATKARNLWSETRRMVEALKNGSPDCDRDLEMATADLAEAERQLEKQQSSSAGPWLERRLTDREFYRWEVDMLQQRQNLGQQDPVQQAPGQPLPGEQFAAQPVDGKIAPDLDEHFAVKEFVDPLSAVSLSAAAPMMQHQEFACDEIGLDPYMSFAPDFGIDQVSASRDVFGPDPISQPLVEELDPASGPIDFDDPVLEQLIEDAVHLHEQQVSVPAANGGPGQQNIQKNFQDEFSQLYHNIPQNYNPYLAQNIFQQASSPFTPHFQTQQDILLDQSQVNHAQTYQHYSLGQGLPPEPFQLQSPVTFLPAVQLPNHSAFVGSVDEPPSFSSISSNTQQQRLIGQGMTCNWNATTAQYMAVAENPFSREQPGSMINNNQAQVPGPFNLNRSQALDNMIPSMQFPLDHLPDQRRADRSKSDALRPSRNKIVKKKAVRSTSARSAAAKGNRSHAIIEAANEITSVSTSGEGSSKSSQLQRSTPESTPPQVQPQESETTPISQPVQATSEWSEESIDRHPLYIVADWLASVESDNLGNGKEGMSN